MQSARFNNLSELLKSVRGEPLCQEEKAYLLVDGTRTGKLSEALRNREPDTWDCLFGVSPGSPLFEASPALIQMGENDERALRMLAGGKYRQSSQLLVSALPLKILTRQLASNLYVEEMDGTRWALALWDPFVLASLVGIQPSPNILIPGPILDPSQIARLLVGISCIAFQNRDGELQYFEVPSLPPGLDAPMMLTQPQMNLLIDFDLPDRVASILRKAEPHHPISDADCHRLCCAAILETRSRNKHGLDDYCDSAFQMLSALGNTKEPKE